MRMITTADWIANVLDAEDRAIRKREGLALTSVGYCYRCIEQDTSTGCMPESDYARTLRERSGSFTTNAEGPALVPPTIGRTR